MTEPSAEAVAELHGLLGHDRIDVESAATYQARIDWLVALYAERLAEMAVEDAYMRGDDQKRRDQASEWHMCCHGTQQRAWSRYQRTLAPSFEDILRDPTSQLDKDGEVARTILNWQGRSMCGQNIPVTSNTASISPRPPSNYVCTKPRPCPDHDDVTGGSTPTAGKATATNAPEGDRG